MDIVCIAIELYVETLKNKNIGTIAIDFFKAFLRVFGYFQLSVPSVFPSMYKALVS